MGGKGHAGSRKGSVLAGAALLAAACASPGPGPAAGAAAWSWQAPAAPGGGTLAKIRAWQVREARVAAPPPAEAATPPRGALGASWDGFVAERRRTLADEVRAWIQAEADARYVSDAGVDRWPTFQEIRARDGDDCDGLELLAIHALRALGFAEESLYRAVIERESDGQQHMVTLWFETPEDPVVIDPTGFASRELVTMSALAGWRPQALFTEQVARGVAPLATEQVARGVAPLATPADGAPGGAPATLAEAAEAGTAPPASHEDDAPAAALEPPVSAR